MTLIRVAAAIRKKGSVPSGPTRPVFVTGASVGNTGTSWPKPAEATAGRLLIGTMHSTSGSVPGFGGDFTPVGSEGDGARDVSTAYRIVQEEDTTYAITTGANNISYTIWAAGTFDPSNPVPDTAWFSDVRGANAAVALPALDASGGIGLFGWSASNDFTGTAWDALSGSSLGNQRTGTAPFTRERYLADGWSGQNLGSPGGSVGTNLTIYGFKINPHPG